MMIFKFHVFCVPSLSDFQELSYYVSYATQNKYYEDRKMNEITFSKANVSFVAFFFQVTRYLQQSIGTVAAIDMAEYANTSQLASGTYILQIRTDHGPVNSKLIKSGWSALSV